MQPVSNGEARPRGLAAPGAGVRDPIRKVEAAVGRLIRALEEERARARANRKRRLEAERLLFAYSQEGEDPIEVAARARALEAENRELRQRMEHGRRKLGTVLARLRFLEDRS